MLARDLGDCRDNLRNSQSMFLIVVCVCGYEFPELPYFHTGCLCVYCLNPECLHWQGVHFSFYLYEFPELPGYHKSNHSRFFFSECFLPNLNIIYLHYKKLMKNVITKLLIKSAKRLPIRGIRR